MNNKRIFKRHFKDVTDTIRNEFKEFVVGDSCYGVYMFKPFRGWKDVYKSAMNVSGCHRFCFGFVNGGEDALSRNKPYLVFESEATAEIAEINTIEHLFHKETMLKGATV